ncbi:tRNA (adenosine(37)-N6)-threonylcarbamoyltransferase complex ATPase subunit type 1 TsaE [Desulfomarina sp.]
MKNDFSIRVKTVKETERIGEILGRNAAGGDVLCLRGDLGAGKTTLTQSIARGLEVPDDYYVSSPSFTILHEYKGRIRLYHMDFYRLSDSDEVIDLGFEELFYLDGLTVIEWPERAEDILPERRIDIEIRLEEDEERILCFSSNNEDYLKRLKEELC